jgi:hypothetical protein
LEDRDDFAVVPELAVAAGSEAVPEFFADQLVIPQDGPDIVEFVGGDHQQGILGGVGETGEERLLALLPGRFGILEGIAADIDDIRHPVAEVGPDVIESPKWARM